MGTLLMNVSRRALLATHVRVCDRLWSRIRGLLGSRSLKRDEACWISPCSSVHTFGMRYTIDVYFLNKKNEIFAVAENLKPNRFSRIYWKAYSVIEFLSGVDRNCGPGDRLALEVKP